MSYESVNSPKHYNNYSIEVIDMMVSIWGVEKTIAFCEMNAFKYRMRMGTKPDNAIDQDLKKEQWYLDKAKQLHGTLLNQGPSDDSVSTTKKGSTPRKGR